MKKKSALILLLVLLCTHTVKAETESQIFSGYICDGNSTTVNEGTFTVSMGLDQDRILVILPTKSKVILSKGYCEIQDYFKICFEDTDFCYHNYELDVDVLKADLTIYKMITEVDITRTVQPTTLLIGETAKAYIKIQNGLGRKATDVYYNESVPLEYFQVSDIEGCDLEGNTIKWSGILNINQEIKCSYRIKALSNTTFSSTANFKYNNGFEIKEINPDVITITVPKSQLDITNKIKDKIETNEEFSLNITLENTNNEEAVTVNNFKISIPKNIEITKKSNEWKQSYNTYSWGGSLNPEESITLYFYLKTPDENTYELKEDATFTIKSMLRTLQKSINFNITNPKLKIYHNITKTMKSGEKGTIKIDLENPSNLQPLNDIEIEIKTGIENLAGKSKLLTGIQQNKRISVINRQFTAPHLINKTIFNIDIIASYKLGEKTITSNESATVTVIPGDEDSTKDSTQDNTQAASKEEEQESSKALKEKIDEKVSETIDKIKTESKSKWIIIISIIVVAVVILNIIIVIKRKRSNVNPSSDEDEEKSK